MKKTGINTATRGITIGPPPIQHLRVTERGRPADAGRRTKVVERNRPLVVGNPLIGVGLSLTQIPRGNPK
jgi:hypothetical protein